MICFYLQVTVYSTYTLYINCYSIKLLEMLDCNIHTFSHEDQQEHYSLRFDLTWAENHTDFAHDRTSCQGPSLGFILSATELWRFITIFITVFTALGILLLILLLRFPLQRVMLEDLTLSQQFVDRFLDMLPKAIKAVKKQRYCNNSFKDVTCILFEAYLSVPIFDTSTLKSYCR